MSHQLRKHEIALALRRLATTYADSIRQFEETLADLCREFDLQEISWTELMASAEKRNRSPVDTSLPIADRLSLSVRWQTKSCFLGNTLLFRFFETLARRPGRYHPYAELLDEVWGGPRSPASVRNVAKRLRDRLIVAGMQPVAAAIDGRTRGHFALRLDCLK